MGRKPGGKLDSSGEVRDPVPAEKGMAYEHKLVWAYLDHNSDFRTRNAGSKRSLSRAFHKSAALGPNSKKSPPASASYHYRIGLYGAGNWP